MTAADDVRLILAEGDDVFTAGTKSTSCMLHCFDEEVQTDNFGGSKQLIPRTFALVCWDDFPDLAEDDQVTVSSVQYKVLSVQRIQDGHLLHVNLQRSGGH